MQFVKGTGAELRMIGALKSVPEIRKTQCGLEVANISLVINKSKYHDAEHPTQWFELTLWGKQAESFVKYAHPGIHVYVEADIDNKVEMIIDQEGKKQYFNTVRYQVTHYSFMDPIRSAHTEENSNHDSLSNGSEINPTGEGAC